MSFRIFLFAFVILFSSTASFADDMSNSSSVLESFNKQVIEKDTGALEDNADEYKHQILFVMGVILLVLIFITAGLGLSMAMHGKELFVWHMLAAGATVFLSVAHAVTSIVWFFPY